MGRIDLPKGWQYITIADIAEEIIDRNVGNNELPVLSCTKYDGLVDSLEYFNRRVFSNDISNYKLVPKNYFAYATNHIEEGSIGYQTRYKKALVSPIYTVFKTKPDIDDSYLYFLFKTDLYRHLFAINTSASVNRRGSLRWKEFSKILIPKPPLPEQKKIAEILSTWDKAIEILGKLIEAKTTLKKGFMQKLLTGKVRFRGVKNKFERTHLGVVANVNMGQSPSSEFYNTFGKGLPLIQGNADCKNRKTFPTTYTTQITKKAYFGDIIMSVRAPVGAIAKCTQESCIGRGVCSIRGDKIDNDYLYQFLLFYEPLWSNYAQGSTFTAVNGNDIRKLEVPFPSEQKEQKKIADVLSSVDREIECLTGIQDQLKSQKQGLMQKLLTGRIRVKA